MTGIGTQYGNNWDEFQYISTDNWVNHKQAGYEKNKPLSFVSSGLVTRQRPTQKIDHHKVLYMIIYKLIYKLIYRHNG